MKKVARNLATVASVITVVADLVSQVSQSDHHSVDKAGTDGTVHNTQSVAPA